MKKWEPLLNPPDLITKLLNKQINTVQYMHQFSILFLLSRNIAIKEMLSEVIVKSSIYLIISFAFSRKCVFYCWHGPRMTWKGRIKGIVKLAEHYSVIISQSWSKIILDGNLKFYTLKDSSKRLIICCVEKVGTVQTPMIVWLFFPLAACSIPGRTVQLHRTEAEGTTPNMDETQTSPQKLIK